MDPIVCMQRRATQTKLSIRVTITAPATKRRLVQQVNGHSIARSCAIRGQVRRLRSLEPDNGLDRITGASYLI